MTYITSPTFGDTIRVNTRHARIGSSKNSYKELQHIESQIASFGVLPDFGYGEDNYILCHMNNQKNKWQMLTGLLGQTNKFDWLCSFLQLKKIEREIEIFDDIIKQVKSERLASRLRKMRNVDNQNGGEN